MREKQGHASTEGPARQPFGAVVLSGIRAEAYQVLSRRGDGSLAEQYFSGIVVASAQGVVADRHVMVAHQMREIINALWKFVDLPDEVVQRDESIVSQLKNQCKNWKCALKIKDKPDWERRIDDWPELCRGQAVQEVLTTLHGVMASLDGEHPDKLRLAAAADAADPSFVKVPREVRERMVENLWKVRDRFNDISHRNIATTDDALDGYVSELGRLIVDFFPSTTAADIDELDALVAEGEADV